jgi:hypothetical protein
MYGAVDGVTVQPQTSNLLHFLPNNSPRIPDRLYTPCTCNTPCKCKKSYINGHDSDPTEAESEDEDQVVAPGAWSATDLAAGVLAITPM